MTIALMLMAASALAGMATSFVFSIWALVLLSPLIAIFCAVVLHAHAFGVQDSVPLIAACVALYQMAYLVAAYLLPPGHVSRPRETDGKPHKAGEQEIRGQHK
ncbi:hypothetical protein [Bradyrhizobium sp.]|uniref:hypothetical protein n=1 Tax=Bradyrhizobium sp. TaxID=376 RepID=UPI0039E6A999